MQAGDTQEVALTAAMGGGLAFVSIDAEVMNVVGNGCHGEATYGGARRAWIERGGACRGNGGAGRAPRVRPRVRSVCTPFTDLPLLIESYATFTSLFDPGGSPTSFGTDYLATAVRSFFAQGGRRCYVVRTGDPVTPDDDAVTGGSTGKAQKLAAMLPDSSYAVDDRRSWHGAGHLGGLPDVSFLALPDLPVLSCSGPTAAVGLATVAPTGPAQFMECTPVTPAAAPSPVYLLPAPRLTPDDYTAWGQNAQRVLDYLAQSNIRDIQFVAAFPLPRDLDAAAAAETASSEEIAQDIHDVINTLMPENIADGANEPPAVPGLSTAFLQLAYPWLTTSGSSVLNESLEPPDGALVGLLARNALTRGAFTDATRIVPSDIFDVSPYLPGRKNCRRRAAALI